MCRRRLEKTEPVLHTADDHYNYAVALMNQRQLVPARKHLTRAIALLPGGGHLYYALALCRGLEGDLSGARSDLQKAIDLDPRSRAAACNDPDFAEIRDLPPLVELLYPEGVSFR